MKLRFHTFLALAVVLCIAATSDAFLAYAREASSRDFNIYPVLWLTIIAQALLSAAILHLAWITLCHPCNDRVVIASFLIVGLVLLSAQLSYYIFSSIGSSLYLLTSPHLRQAGGYLTVIALTRLALNAWKKD